MQVSKKITKSGGITVPRALRQETGIHPGVPVEVISDDYGIHIMKRVPTCICCGSVDEVKEVHRIEICKSCAEEIKEVFAG